MKSAVVENEQEIETPDLEPDVLDLDPETPEVEDDSDPDDSDEEELIVTIGEETPPQDEEKGAPQWVKDLRKADREKSRKIRELEQKLAQTEQPKKPQLSAKPTLEACDYDTDRFEIELDKWKEQKAAHDQRVAKEQELQRKQQEAFEAKFDAYKARKAEVAPKLKGFDDAEAAVRTAFSEPKLGAILARAADPALLFYAIGKDEKRVEELSKMDDVEFIWAVARMETQLKTSSRKPSAAPEQPIRGSASTSGADKRLDQLYDEAARTGDLSKVRAYKAKLKK